MTEDNNWISVKSKRFAVRVVKLCKILRDERGEYIMSKQLFRSGTSIGANVREARNAQSRADFINKHNIALKEADETCYWLELLKESDYLTTEEFESIYNNAEELVKLLVSIVKTTKNNNNGNHE